MKCKHCGSEWSSTVSTAVCPFCRKPLQENTSTQQTLTDVLVQIRSISGVETLGNGRAVISSFKDLAPNLKKECTMLSYLEKCGGIAELYGVRSKSASERNLAMARVVCRMTDELMVSEEAAKRVCDIYMQVLCGREKQAEDEAKAAAEQKAKEEAERKAKLETEFKARLEAVQKAKAEAKAAEERTKADAEARAKAATELMARAKAEAEKKAKEEAERKAKAEAERKARLDAEVKAKIDAALKARAEAEKKTEAEKKQKHTPPKPVVQKPPQSVTKQSVKQESSPRALFSAAMWVIWPIAVLMYVLAVEDISDEPVVFIALALALGLLWWGRSCIKSGERGMGSVYIVIGSVLLTVLTMDFYDDDQWVPIMICVLCAITGICNGLEAAEES